VMSKPKTKVSAAKSAALFDRIVSILEQARGNVVRAVNTNMVLAYWLIGREIVEEVQRGKGRAMVSFLSVQRISSPLPPPALLYRVIPLERHRRASASVPKQPVMAVPCAAKSRNTSASRPAIP